MQFSNKNNGKNICDQFDWHSRNHTNKLKYENEKSEKMEKKKKKLLRILDECHFFLIFFIPALYYFTSKVTHKRD